ncbi:MAG: PIG-L deacetylase family protein [Pseudonocardiaceae bacterium]
MCPIPLRRPLHYRGHALPSRRGLPERPPHLHARAPTVNSVRRVLAVSPHLDDAALSAGATLADLAARGVDVQVCTLFTGAPHEPLSAVARAFHARCDLPRTHPR